MLRGSVSLSVSTLRTFFVRLRRWDFCQGLLPVRLQSLSKKLIEEVIALPADYESCRAWRMLLIDEGFEQLETVFVLRRNLLHLSLCHVLVGKDVPAIILPCVDSAPRKGPVSARQC